MRARLARPAPNRRSAASAADGRHVIQARQVAIAVIAPQSEWPQITTSVTRNAATAYSTDADTPPGSAVRRHDVAGIANHEQVARSRCVTSSGTSRLSEHEMNSARGFWLRARSRNSAARSG